MRSYRPEIEHIVRETAYQLWCSAGCPEGRSETFWELARDITSDVDDDRFDLGELHAGVRGREEFSNGVAA